MIKTRTLSNGVRVIMEEMSQVQSIAIGIWVRAGAIDETDKNAGISHFVEHMMFKGTENRTAKDIAADIDRIGGQINAFTGKEATCYYVKSLSENYKEAADVLVDMLENSLFDKNEMDKERKVICEEIKMTKDQPDDLAHDTLIEQLFKGCPLGNSIIGTPTSLKRITHNVIRNYVDKQYVRDRIVVSVAGKFDDDDVCDYFSDKFMSLRQTLEDESQFISKASVKSNKVIKKDIQQSHICLGAPGVTLNDDNSFVYQIINNIMGGSMSSRLFQNIREEKGLAYSVFSSMGTFGNGGYFEIYAGVSHDKIRAAIMGIKEELDRLASEKVTADELESSKEQLKSSYVFSQESTSTRMILNGKNYILINKVFMPEEVIQGYDNVTIEKIEEVKEIMSDFNNYSAVVVSNTRADLGSIMGK
ncbi:M16 family metallopeptidase [Aminicella lysinilytica]|uniref:M16 family metallopeptidase n=1 Tax=Aminicella lysinilytica TaxID=433323 RepID=UPI0026EA1E5B|nr:pitrilysin family protein [Aminicella lysinilytica]